jgi:SAM-dependent methyltransferase
VSETSYEPGSHFASRARYVSDYGASVIKLLDPKAGESILDVGCGDGTLSRLLAVNGSQVVGIDIDPDMVRAAVSNGVDARLLDGCRLPFEREFDAVFSNSALHFMKPPGDVIRGVARALKPGGRFAAELGTHGNIAAIVTALIAVLQRHGIDGGAHVPWIYLTMEEYCDLLESCGFAIETVHKFHRPTPMPGGIKGWIDILGRWFLDTLPLERRAEACEEVAQLLSYTLKSSTGLWIADYHHLRFKARLVST